MEQCNSLGKALKQLPLVTRLMLSADFLLQYGDPLQSLEEAGQDAPLYVHEVPPLEYFMKKNQIPLNEEKTQDIPIEATSNVTTSLMHTTTAQEKKQDNTLLATKRNVTSPPPKSTETETVSSSSSTITPAPQSTNSTIKATTLTSTTLRDMELDALLGDALPTKTQVVQPPPTSSGDDELDALLAL